MNDKDVSANVKYYDLNNGGRIVGHGSSFFLPHYLDWMPIEAKVFWFLAVGDGHPDATHLVFVSQGEHRLVKLDTPLRNLNYKERQEQEHGLEQRTQDWIDEQGISRSPRNQ